DEREVEREVSRARGVFLTRFVQELGGVLAHRFEKPVTVALGRELDQRLVHELRQEVQHVAAVDVLRRADRLRGLQRKSAGEYRETAQQRSLARREQVVAPVDARPQRLLAGQGGAASY